HPGRAPRAPPPTLASVYHVTRLRLAADSSCGMRASVGELALKSPCVSPARLPASGPQSTSDIRRSVHLAGRRLAKTAKRLAGSQRLPSSPRKWIWSPALGATK